MFEYLLSEGNAPFTVALGVMLGIAALEGTLTLLGFGLSHVIDSLVPDSLVEADLGTDIDLDMNAPELGEAGTTAADFGHADPGSVSALSRLLGWLCVGKVPVLILLVVFLTVFGLAGLFVQGVIHNLSGVFLPGLLASIPAFLIALPSVRVIGKGIARMIPKDQTEAVSEDSFIGRLATITIGTASKGMPAEAKLNDGFGQSHYVMVEPDNDETFTAGDQVLLVQQSGATFKIIRNTRQSLIDV